MAERADTEYAESYYRHEGETFDTAGLDADGAVACVGEVEMPSHNSQATLTDYEKLAAVDAEAVWLLKNKSEVVSLISLLEREGIAEPSDGVGDTMSLDEFRAYLEAADLPGIADVWTMQSLNREVSP